jgi:hypothetical protein
MARHPPPDSDEKSGVEMNYSNNAIALVEKLSSQATAIHETLQNPFLDSLAYSQHERLLEKLKKMDFSSVTRVYLGAHLKHARSTELNQRFIPLTENFLEVASTEMPPGSIVLLLNNDIGKNLMRYVQFYNAHPELLFVIWDWDSQHWLQMSALLAMHSDYYISASSENTFTLSHFNPHVLGPVFAGVHQWSREFLYRRFDIMIGRRFETPFGPHVHYEKYPKRSRVVATLAQHFDSVRFADNQYKAKSEEENLREWAGYKSHWIVPVLGGVPIRVYNALITGGIPILPSHYRNMPEVAGLGSSPVFYNVHDVLNPDAVIAAAATRFDSEDGGGLLQRISESMARDHVDTRCAEIVALLRRNISALLDGRGSEVPGHYHARSFFTLADNR